MTLVGASTAPPDRGRRTGASALIGRLGWGVADQAVSSLSNFALGLYVARTFGAAGFGAFTLAFVTYTVILNASRGLTTDPLLVRHSTVRQRQLRTASSASAATALLVGVITGAACVVAGLVIPGPVGPVFVALGVGLPGILLQDAWRFSFFAGARPAATLLNDVVWTTLLAGGLVLLHRTGAADVAGCLFVFGMTATVASLVGTLQAGVLPRPSRIRSWVRDHRDLSVRYLIENVSISGAAQLRSFVLGALTGLAAVGHVRTAEILMGPFVVVLMGISQVAVPEAARVLKRASARLARFCFALGAVQALGALAWGAVLLLVLPHGLGEALLKGLWTPASPLIAPVALAVAAGSFSTGATAGLRAMGVAWRSLRAQLTAAAVYLVGGVGGAVLGGDVGTCWGVTAANAIGALVWWHHLRSALREHHQSTIGERVP